MVEAASFKGRRMSQGGYPMDEDGVEGDVDAFLASCEGGQQERDYAERCHDAQYKLDQYYVGQAQPGAAAPMDLEPLDASEE